MSKRMGDGVMEVNKYKTKPVEIEAVEYTGDNEHFLNEWSNGKVVSERNGGVMISTLEGDMRGDVGDFIIKGLRGEYYPCKPDVFHQKYELL